MFSSLSSNSLWQRKKRNVVVTAIGSTTKMPAAKAGASMSNTKRHAVVFVAIIETNSVCQMKYMYIDSVVTAIGTMLIKTLKLVAGAQNENAKPRVSKFATNINFK